MLNISRIFSDEECYVIYSALVSRIKEVYFSIQIVQDVYDFDDSDDSKRVKEYEAELVTIRHLISRFLPGISDSSLDFIFKIQCENALNELNLRGCL